jgi:putative flippase GtrA
VRLADRSGLVRFLLVGGLGFCVDASLLLYLVQSQDANIYVARLGSFAGAVLVTWLLNRSLVFRPRAGTNQVSAVSGELARYLLVQGLGVAINFAVFAAVIVFFPILTSQPLIPLAVASAVAMAWNYIGARWFAFDGARAIPLRG